MDGNDEKWEWMRKGKRRRKGSRAKEERKENGGTGGGKIEDKGERRRRGSEGSGMIKGKERVRIVTTRNLNVYITLTLPF